MWYILIILIVALILSARSLENFTSNKQVNCTPPQKKINKCIYNFDGEWSTCPSNSLYPGEKCYKCPWKRPGLTLTDDPKCCRNKCFKSNRKPTGIPYYCEQHSICIKKYANSPKDMSCGIYTLYGNPAKIFPTFNQCSDHVYKFNNLNKEQCLTTNGSGWCTDYRGDGICTRGTPEGPTNQIRYNTCFVNQKTNRNSWIYGYDDPHKVLRNSSI